VRATARTMTEPIRARSVGPGPTVLLRDGRRSVFARWRAGPRVLADQTAQLGSTTAAPAVVDARGGSSRSARLSVGKRFNEHSAWLSEVSLRSHDAN
jgi:hypothetical protein